MAIEKIYLASGCYWGAEKYFSLVNGVVKTEVGFANGKTKDPIYSDVKKGNTGHAETTYIEYDSDILKLDVLLSHYFNIIDPTSLNKQGEDEGTQYRTGIYYVEDGQKAIIEDFIKKEAKKYDKPIVVEVEKLNYYYPADEYHQKYLDKNPDGYCHIGKEKFEEAKKPTW